MLILRKTNNKPIENPNVLFVSLKHICDLLLTTIIDDLNFKSILETNIDLINLHLYKFLIFFFGVPFTLTSSKPNYLSPFS